MPVLAWCSLCKVALFSSVPVSSGTGILKFKSGEWEILQEVRGREG